MTLDCCQIDRVELIEFVSSQRFTKEGRNLDALIRALDVQGPYLSSDLTFKYGRCGQLNCIVTITAARKRLTYKRPTEIIGGTSIRTNTVAADPKTKSPTSALTTALGKKHTHT